MAGSIKLPEGGAVESGILDALRQRVRGHVFRTPTLDIHTHLYDPAFGPLLLWGIDELLVYHYLVAESFRFSDLPPGAFWKLSKAEQAQLIWDRLFVAHSPISEARRGVLTTLRRLGIDAKKNDLPGLRRWFAQWKPDDYISRCLELGGVRRVFMTNSPFDGLERAVWQKGFPRDPRFAAALRIDPLLLAWPDAGARLSEWGYAVDASLGEKSFREIRRFLSDWTRRMDAQYLMASLPPEFDFPDANSGGQVLEKAVLPHCLEFGLPLALMLGVRRGVNRQLQMAGDGAGVSRMQALANLCAGFSENKFLATALARENQHELAVLARKFRNLHPFGCWWFMNIPSLVREITQFRLELLGVSFTAQHSDARVLDQLIYKWDHAREAIAEVLADQYAKLARAGWMPDEAEIARDVQALFGGAFEEFRLRPLTT